MDKKVQGLKIEGRDREADLYKLTRAWIEGLEWEPLHSGVFSGFLRWRYGKRGQKTGTVGG